MEAKLKYHLSRSDSTVRKKLLATTLALLNHTANAVEGPPEYEQNPDFIQVMFDKGIENKIHVSPSDPFLPRPTRTLMGDSVTSLALADALMNHVQHNYRPIVALRPTLWYDPEPVIRTEKVYAQRSYQRVREDAGNRIQDELADRARDIDWGEWRYFKIDLNYDRPLDIVGNHDLCYSDWGCLSVKTWVFAWIPGGPLDGPVQGDRALQDGNDRAVLSRYTWFGGTSFEAVKNIVNPLSYVKK